MVTKSDYTSQIIDNSSFFIKTGSQLYNVQGNISTYNIVFCCRYKEYGL